MAYGKVSEARDVTTVLAPIDGSRRHHAELRRRVHERDDFTCQLCGAIGRPPDDYDGRYAIYDVRGGCDRKGNYLQIDHVVPRSRGGTHQEANLQTLCYYCNVRKGAR